MKSNLLVIILLALILSIPTAAQAPSAPAKDAIDAAVKVAFDGLCSAINRKDAAAWSAYYSQDGFISAFAGPDVFATRRAWVEAITANFAARERQHIDSSRSKSPRWRPT